MHGTLNDTLPRFLREVGPTCSRFFVQMNVAQNTAEPAPSMAHALKMTGPGALIMIGNAGKHRPQIEGAWNLLVRNGWVTNSSCETTSNVRLPKPWGRGTGYCMGSRTSVVTVGDALSF